MAVEESAPVAAMACPEGCFKRRKAAQALGQVAAGWSGRLRTAYISVAIQSGNSSSSLALATALLPCEDMLTKVEPLLVLEESWRRAVGLRWVGALIGEAPCMADHCSDTLHVGCKAPQRTVIVNS